MTGGEETSLSFIHSTTRVHEATNSRRTVAFTRLLSFEAASPNQTVRKKGDTTSGGEEMRPRRRPGLPPPAGTTPGRGRAGQGPLRSRTVPPSTIGIPTDF